MAVRRSYFCCSSSLIFLLISWLVWTLTDNLQDIRTPGISIRSNLKYRTARFRCIRYFRGRIPYCCNSTPSFNLSALCLLCSNDVEPNPGDSCESKQSISVFYQNVRSLKAFVKDCDGPSSYISKLSLFQDLVYGADYDMVAITETWLNPSVSSLEILPYGYDLYRKDRESRVGGGVMLAVKNKIAVKGCLDLPGETVAVEIKLSADKLLLVVVCYRAPNDHEFISQFKIIADVASQDKYSMILI